MMAMKEIMLMMMMRMVMKMMIKSTALCFEVHSAPKFFVYSICLV